MTIGTKFTGSTSLGTSTTATLLGGATLDLPDGARQIVGVLPFLTSPAGNTANEPVSAEIYIESDDLQVVPYHVLPHPIGSSLLKAVCALQGNNSKNFYPLYAPCKGGERLRIYGKALFSHTIAPKAGCLIIYSDQPPTKPKCMSQIATYTNTGIAAARVAGTALTVVGGKYLKEIFGYAVGTTVAALKGLEGYIDLNSEGFIPSWSLHLPINPASGQVDTNIQEAISGVSRLEVGVAMKDKCVINNGFTLGTALTTTGNWIVGVLYN